MVTMITQILSVLAIFCVASANDAPEHKVTLHSTLQAEKFPAVLPLTLKLEDSEPVAMLLDINPHVDPALVPVEVDGIPHEEDARMKNVRYYTDPVNHAAFAVTAHPSDNGLYTHSAEGVVRIDNMMHDLEKADDGSITAKRSLRKRAIHEGADFEDVNPHGNLDEEKDYINVKIVEQPHHFAKREAEEEEDGSTERLGKRSSFSKTDFFIETMLVLDHTIYDYWLKMSGDHHSAISDMKYLYFQHFNAMNKAYQTLDRQQYGISITPILHSIQIVTSAQNSSFTTNAIRRRKVNPPREPFDSVVDGSLFFTRMAQWKEKHGLGWRNPDHVMAITKYDIVNEKVVGYAIVGQLCQGNNIKGTKGSLSLIEDNGMGTWRTMAHELGHGLGADHDGHNNRCEATDNYLLSPLIGSLKAETRDNSFTFSPCSWAQMKSDLLGQSGARYAYYKTCALDNIYEVQETEATVLPGSKVSLDEQCVMSFGEGHTYYRLNHPCMRLTCRMGNKVHMQNDYPADGSPCGSRQTRMCYQGQCVPKRDIFSPKQYKKEHGCSSPPAGCTDNAGFSATFRGSQITCADIAKKMPSLCWTYESYARECRATCHEVFCDTRESHCPQVTTQPKCEDNMNMKLNKMSCPEYCANLERHGKLRFYTNKYPVICQHCCKSCRCHS